MQCSVAQRNDIRIAKSGPNPGVFNILISKCTSRYNGVHFFDIVTSKSVPKLRYFADFDLEMYFAPQRRGLFRHLSFQKWPENGVYFEFEMCFTPQRRAIFHLLSGQATLYPPLWRAYFWTLRSPKSLKNNNVS